MLLCGIHNYNLNEWRIRCDSIYYNLNDHSIPAGLFSCFQILSIKSNEAISISMHVALSSFQIDCPKINSQKGDYWFRRHEIFFMAADMYFQMSFQNSDSEFTRLPASHQPMGLGKSSTILGGKYLLANILLSVDLAVHAGLLLLVSLAFTESCTFLSFKFSIPGKLI